MSDYFVCAQGHRWQPEPGNPASSQPASVVCPMCAALSHLTNATENSHPADPDLTSPGAANQPEPGESSGRFEVPTVPGYEILEGLGRGSMGVVFKALHRRLNRVVALKMILGGKEALHLERTRFLNEAEVVARLHHPYIVQVYEIGHHEESLYLALEYVNGGNLARKAARRPQPARAAAQLMEQLARAVHYAHRCGIVHRDLKPANILLAGSDHPEAVLLDSSPDAAVRYEPKITDFGIAKRVEISSELTTMGQILGTPNYMAPEQALGQHALVGPAADVFSLGGILYFLLTGDPPFQGNGVLATLDLVKTQDPVPPRRVQPQVPRDLETICLKCLEKDPAKRYATAEALAEDLKRFLEDRPIQARPVGSLERVRKWARRYPAWAALFGVLALVVTLGFPTVTVLWLAAVQARGEATTRAAAETWANAQAQEQKQQAELARDEANDLRRQEEGREARLALDRGVSFCEQGEIGRGLLWMTRSLELATRAGAPDLETAIRVNLADWSGQLSRPGHVFPSRGAGLSVNAIAFSPDGQKALLGVGWLALQYDVRTGKPIAKSVVPYALRGVYSVAYCPDGRTFLTGGSDSKASFWDLEAGKQVGQPLTLGGKNVWIAAFSRDGKKILLAGDVGKGGAARLFDAGTGQPLCPLLQHTESHVYTAALSPDARIVLTGSMDRTARFWDAGTGQPIGPELVHEEGVAVVAFSPDGQTGVTGCRDGRIHFWDVATGQRRGESLRHLGNVTAIVFSPDGRMLLTCSERDAARLWDGTTHHPIGPAFWQLGGTSAAAFSPDSTLCLIGGFDGTARLWHLPRAKAVGPPMRHRKAVDKVAFSSDGKTIATASFNGVHLWSAASSQPGGELWNGTAIRTAALAPDGRRAATSSWYQDILLWDVAASSSPPPAPPAFRTRNPPHRMAFSADGKLLLTVSSATNRQVRMWDVDTRQLLKRSFDHPAEVVCLAVGRDGRLLATGCADGTVWFWDIGTGESFRPALKGVEAIDAIALSPDGRVVATGSLDGTVHLWEIATGRLRDATLYHQGAVLDVAFSRDGELLATASADRTGRLWDVATGMQLGPALRHQDAVQAVAFHPDGRTVLTAGRDRLAQLWRLPEPLPAGSVKAIKLWIEVLAGMELDPAGVVRKLDENGLAERRQALAEPAHADFLRAMESSGVVSR